MTDPILCDYAIYYNNIAKDHPHITIHKLNSCNHYKQRGRDGSHIDGKLHWFLAETYEDAQSISQVLHELYDECEQKDCPQLRN